MRAARRHSRRRLRAAPRTVVGRHDPRRPRRGRRARRPAFRPEVEDRRARAVAARQVQHRGRPERVDDLAVARRLVERADVVLEGFRPGVMARLGLAPVDRNVWCALPGFASDDPRAGLAAWEGIVGAATGHYTRSPRSWRRARAFRGAACVVVRIARRGQLDRRRAHRT